MIPTCLAGLRCAAALAGVLFAAGCSAVETIDGERLGVRSEAFADYVESVFRRQNAVATELAFALEAEELDTPRYARLESAEVALLDACAGLNEIAAGRRDRQEVGGLRALRAARRTPDCERATREAEALLGPLESDPLR